MLIGCLGWGSLVWDPRDLPVRGPWFTDGPFLPIEFARHSSRSRLTLVLIPDQHRVVAQVRSLWIALSASDVDEAKGQLQRREQCSARDIGSWTGRRTKSRVEQRIAQWAKTAGLDAVVWTALPPKFHGTNGNMPTVDDALRHLHSLRGEDGAAAEEYIRKAPQQIDTEYRRRIEKEFGWTRLSLI